jgi:uncharacterized protein (TIGR03382 family)
MSPTGSTSEQKSPTEWKLRLLLALVVSVLLMMATTASAGWSARNISSTPNEVRVWAPEVYSVTSDAGAWMTRADGSTVFINTAGVAVGSYYAPGTTCFAAFANDGSGRGHAPCDRNLQMDLARAVRRVRSTETGANFALLESSEVLNVSQLRWTPAVGSTPWSLRAGDIQGPPSKGLGVLRMGDSEDVLLGTLPYGPGTQHKLHWYRGTIKMAEYSVPDAGGTPVVRDMEVIDLFPAGGSTPTALVGWGNSLYRGTLGDGGTPFGAVPYPGGEGSVIALDVNTGAGAQHGDGFGMATVQRDGGVTLLRAFPAARPGDIGTQWRVSPIPDGGLIAPRSLECYGASFCVIAQATSSGNNIFVYRNEAQPTLTVESSSSDPFILPPGTSRTINIRASDADEDPVLVKVEPSSLSLTGLSMTTTAVDGGVELMLNAGTACSNIAEPIAITATDGLDSHAIERNYVLQVQRTAAPSAPMVSPSSLVVHAGSESRTLMAASATAPCGIHEFTWTPLSQDLGRLTPFGQQNARALFTPPATVCNPLGESHLYRVRAVEDGGVSSPPTDVSIQVLPWGAPKAPFDGGQQQVTLQAGAGRGELRPNETHVCDVPGGNFPGVDTLWRLAGGGGLPPGVRLLAEDGGLVGSSAVTPVLRIEADECTQAEFDLTVQHYTRGDVGDGGPESDVHVTVRPDLNPLSEATLVLGRGTATPESAAGTVSVGGLRCLDQRGNLGLTARIALTSDGGIVREGIFPVPGSWQFMLGDSCLGTTYGLEGELLVDGVPRTVVPGDPITVPRVEDAELQPMVAPFLTARCGEPATGVLEQRALHPCSELPISWAHVGGITLTQASYTGHRIEVATQDTDFAELIGRSVVMRMSTMTGTMGQTAELTQEVPILTEPFVELQRRTEKATGADVDLIGVSVELRNTTECGVSQVDHMERLEGTDYVPGSARFNGAPVEAEVEGNTLTVRGLVLEGSTTGRLTYVVRPRLLESSRFEGQASVRGVPVTRPQDAPPSGCGCSGASSGLAALGLAGLSVLLRRRRAR